ncbi:MAG: hypothetical protein ACK5BN_09950 [Planctomycetota bacterium]
MSQCDLVKFAAVVPSERDHEVAWHLAAAFVEATRGDRTVQSPPLPPARSPEDRR